MGLDALEGNGITRKLVYFLRDRALTPAPTPAASSSTPMTPHATLKRKATGAEPAAGAAGGADAQASGKRPPRKRGRTTGGG